MAKLDRNESRSRPEWWLQRVRYTAAEPTAWLHHAWILRQAAEDLWITGNAHQRSPGSELGVTVLAQYRAPDAPPIPETGGSTRDVCFMLFGFALENLAKGIIVCRDPKRVSRGKLARWHRRGSGHQLVRLFESAEIPFTIEEREVLERMSRTTEWQGRYPVPMDFNNARDGDRLIGILAVSNVWPADDYARLSALYDAAKAALIRAMEAVPPLPEDHDFGEAAHS